MTVDLITLTEQKTLERYERNTARTVRTQGIGATPVSLKITKDCLGVLRDYIQDQIKDPLSLLKQLKVTRGPDRAAFRTLLVSLKMLPPETVSLCVLNAVLHAIGRGSDFRKMCLSLGMDIQGELWAAKLLENDERLFNRIERSVRRKHSSVKQRQVAARAIAARAGYKSSRWRKEAIISAGGLLATLCFWALPDVFYVTEGRRKRVFPHVREEALDAALDAVSKMVAGKPVALPCIDPPLTWTRLHTGGYPDERLKGRTTLLRRHSKIQAAEVRDAIRNGTMQPVLDAVNALQSVPWKINTRVLEVMQHCIDNKIAVPGLPRPTPYEKPAHPKPWEKMNEDERRAWRRRADKIETANRGLVADCVLLGEDFSTAKLLASEERFYTPYNADWRGRVYPMPHFNFQRDDRVRALFQFADGAPIGNDGLYWLKVHAANCGDFDKISKRPLAERTSWVEQNWEWIQDTASNPFDNKKWMRADKPFLFLAACMELEAALSAGAEYVTTLPISFDGSCSGLQHLASMTRDEETAKLVNLTPNATPQDVYQSVADLVRSRISADARGATADPEVSRLASRCLAHGITRSLVKRNVMTFAYSSKKFGMGQQHIEDLMRPLETEVMAGERSEHPFDIDGDNGREAAKYLASHIYDAITETVMRPAEAMGFLQSLARAMAHEGKSLRWTTPAGLPWVNAYYEPNYVRVKLWLHDAAVTMRLAVGDTKEVDKDKAANGVAPNFVHACDAAHLMLTVNAAVRDGIRNIATVHDSFGCLAPAAARFNEIIREQFVVMYQQHDMLTEVLEQAKCDLTQHNWHRLPDAVGKGTLNIEEVKNAQFAFA